MDRKQISLLRHTAQNAELAIKGRERTGEHPAAWRFHALDEGKLRVSADNDGRVPINEVARALDDHRVEVADWVRQLAVDEENSARADLDKCLKGLQTDGPQ